MQFSPLLYLFLSLLPSVHSYNFLIFCPLFGHSHTTFFARIADILTEAGHNVTFFTPTIDSEFRTFKYTKLTKDVVHLDPSPALKAYGDLLSTNNRWWTQEFSIFEIPQSARFFREVNRQQHNVLAENLELLDDLKTRNFDLLIFESLFSCAFPMMEYLEIKAFAVALSVTYDSNTCGAIGESTMPSHIPQLMSQSNDRMTLHQRFVNTIIRFSPFFFPIVPTLPSYTNPNVHFDPLESLADASFVFMNSNPYLEFPRATLTKNVQVGGISVNLESLKSGKVDEEWDGILNLREKTMLVSFGSVILSKDMPIERRISIAEAMRKFPEVTFIWKYEDDDTDTFAKGIGNIHFAKWVPQRELLADPRLSAFMTHGGLGSVNEASYLGIPTVMCPIFGDQMRNAKMLARHNGSIEITKYELGDFELVEQVFKRILYDESFTKAAKLLAEQLEFQPVKPKELFLKHAEFAARFGRLPSLDPYSRQMSIIQYYLLDIAAIIFSLSFLIFYSLIRFSRCLFSLLSPSKHKIN